MTWIIGIDGGATSTKAVVADSEGRVVARAEGACISPYLLPGAQIEANLRAICRELLAAAGVTPSDIRGVCLGVSGCEREEDRACLAQISERVLPGVRAEVVNDAVIALVGGCGGMEGVIVISGTGSIALGRTADGHMARAGGYGHLLGDEGSGYEIARQGLIAVLRADDGRGEATRLTPLVLKRLEIAGPQGIKPWTKVVGGEKAAIAALAPLVFEAAAADDSVCNRILDEAAEELALAAEAVMGRLWKAPCCLRVSVAGSVILSQDVLFERFMSAMKHRCPHGEVMRPLSDPVNGACTYLLHLLH
ncbi:hypothetical protein JXA47_07585 [Candidatus Sumerlaeota bacterium]|nr:hypothetical protein [Candidatus Sumerlaeota bacterium]